MKTLTTAGMLKPLMQLQPQSLREIRNFAVNSVNEAPSAPVQLAPLHNSYQTTRYPHLEWTTASDPDPGDQVSYRIYYGQSESAMIL
jgi:hypothetical protein